jgi:hypothetical protein
MTHRKAPAAPSRRGFIRYHAGADRYEIHIPTLAHAHLFEHQPWIEVDLHDKIPAEVKDLARAAGILYETPKEARP